MAFLPSFFQFCVGVFIEYMHCALHGVNKLLISLWIDLPKCQHTAHDTHLHVNLINKRIQQIRVPAEIPRKP